MDVFKDIVPAILLTKDSTILDNEKDYNAFIVNKALSFHYDCILFVNQMNIHNNLDGKLQFHFLLNSIRSHKRPFQKWQKRETVEDLEVIKEYFNYSNEKAKEALTVLSDVQINEIKKLLSKGGLNAKSRQFNRGNAT